MKISLQVEVEAWAMHALRGRRFITVYEVARMLGISTRTAGKVLRKLEELGIVERWSRRAYRVRLGAGASEAGTHGEDKEADSRDRRALAAAQRLG